MISQSLVELVEKNADKLAKAWLTDVRQNVHTPFYQTHDEDRLYRRAFEIFSHLGHFLSLQTPKQETVEFYRDYGRERCGEGFPLSELIYAFVLFRRHLWLFILKVGFLDTAYDLLRALELNNRVILFFDRAIHNIAVGYEDCAKKNVKEVKNK